MSERWRTVTNVSPIAQDLLRSYHLEKSKRGLASDKRNFGMSGTALVVAHDRIIKSVQ